jgi:hypothetical protein
MHPALNEGNIHRMITNIVSHKLNGSEDDVVSARLQACFRRIKLNSSLSIHVRSAFVPIRGIRVKPYPRFRGGHPFPHAGNPPRACSIVIACHDKNQAGPRPRASRLEFHKHAVAVTGLASATANAGAGTRTCPCR